MKKTAKNTLLAVLMFIFLLSLTGCGGDKLVATIEEGDLKQTVEIKFKDDVASEIKMTFDCESKDDAKDGKEFFEKQFEGAKVKQSGKKITITMDMETFAKQYGITNYEKNKDSLTKEKLTEMFESLGYDVK